MGIWWYVVATGMYKLVNCVHEHYDQLTYRMAGNIGREFNLAVWWMSDRSAKYSAHGDINDLVVHAAAAVPDLAHTEIAVP